MSVKWTNALDEDIGITATGKNHNKKFKVLAGQPESISIDPDDATSWFWYRLDREPIQTPAKPCEALDGDAIEIVQGSQCRWEK